VYRSGGDLPQEQIDQLIEYGFINPNPSSPVDRVSDPDAFGYYFIDSNEDNGPVYDWVEPSGGLTNLASEHSLLDDDYMGPFGIGFDFPFYGTTQTELYIQSNGVISFADQFVTLANSNMPTTSYPAHIAWFWDDLDPNLGTTGTVYMENRTINGREYCVVYFIDYNEYPDSNGNTITAQVLLGENGDILMQYQGWTGTLDLNGSTIGIQNIDGTIGLEYIYNGTPETISEELAVRYTSSNAIIDGTVTGDGTAVEGAEVFLHIAGEETPVDFIETGADGGYEFEVMADTYDIHVFANGWLPASETDVVVEEDETVTVDLDLDAPSNTYSFSGTVTSADTPDTPVVGVTVEVDDGTGPQTAVTGTDGSFDFGQMDEGVYDIHIAFDPVGSEGYHDLYITNFILDQDGPWNFEVYEILAPQNTQAQVGDGFITVSWDPPANHVNMDELDSMIADREAYLGDLRTLNNAKTREAAPVIEAELFMLRNERDRRLGLLPNGEFPDELDELEDFLGYKIRINDEIQEELYGQTSVTLTGFVSGTEYTFEVAADYGYGEDNLVFGEGSTVEYESIDYFYVELLESEWIEINPNNPDHVYEGTGMSLSDDGYTDLINFPAGEAFNFWGIDQSSFMFSANGVISFNPGYIPYWNSTIPSTGNPNNAIYPFWEDLYPPSGNSPDPDPFYYINEDNNQVIVQWDCPPLGNQTNVLHFQVIMDLTLDYFQVNYLSAVSDWNTGATIGVENADGTRAFTYPDVPTDNLSILWSSNPNALGTLAGTVSDEDGEPIEGVEISIYPDGEENPLAMDVSGADGSYEFTQIWGGTYDIEAVMYGFQTTWVEDVEVLEGETTTEDIVMPEQTLTMEIDGTVVSADTPDTPVEGVAVYSPQLDMTVTTGTDGSFTFGEQLHGLYDFTFSFDPQGSTGYHNISVDDITVDETYTPLDIEMFEILPPENFTGNPGDGFVHLSWDPPLNHSNLATLEHQIELREGYLDDLRGLRNDKSAEMIPVIEAELYRLRNEYDRMERRLYGLDELDDLEDFQGYKVRQDGVILDLTLGTNATDVNIYDLTPDETYTFEVAADYGYGDDYLVWAEGVDIEYTEVNYTWAELTEFMWVEINPNAPDPDYDGIALNFGDDSVSEMLALPTDVEFFFYGEPYTEFNISSNGVVSFTDQWISYFNGTIPNTSLPNNAVYPFWEDLYPPSGNSPDPDPFYYIDEDNNRWIVQWDCPPLGNQANVLHFQAIFNWDVGAIFFNYRAATENWSTGATIGVENSNGLRATSYPNVPTDELSLVFTTGEGVFGDIAGTVSNTDGNPIEDVLVELYNADETNVIATTMTDAAGEYGFDQLFDGDYDLRFVKFGYTTLVSENVTVVVDETTTHDVTLQDEGNTVDDLGGTVMSADQMNEAVENATVYCPQLDETVFTDEDGVFSFGEQIWGVYDFELSFDPQGSTGYHNRSYLQLVVDDGFEPLDLEMFEILAPQSLEGQTGDAFISLSWDAPLNHDELDQLAARVEYNRNYLENLRDMSGEKAEQVRAEVESELYRLENHLEYAMERAGLMELDDLEDFQGYRIRQDGVILDDMIAPDQTQTTLTGFTSGESYTFETAADYGYDEDYLVWSNSVTIDYESLDYHHWDWDEFIWYEIDPNNPDHMFEGTGLSLTDDGYSEMIDFPDGEVFNFWGIDYSSFQVSANGVITFTPGYVSFGNTPIPNANFPNNGLYPFWEDLNPYTTPDSDPYYYYDDDLNQMIVEWTAPLYANSTNVLIFQVVMNLEEDYAFFSYHSAAESWDTGATIGVENTDGTRAFTYDGTISDELSVLWGTEFPAQGTITGTISHCTIEEFTPVEGAAVFLDDDSEPIAFTDANGTFTAEEIQEDIYTVSVRMDGHWPVVFQGVEVFGDSITVLDTTAMTYPDGSTDPTSMEMLVELLGDSTASGSFTLSSTGCGPLHWSANLMLLNNAAQNNGGDTGPVNLDTSNELDNLWDMLFSIPVPADAEFYSAVTTPDQVIALSRAEELFYLFDHGGNFVGTVPVPADMFDSQNNPPYDMAYDPNTDDLYIGNADGSIFSFNEDFSQVMYEGEAEIPVHALGYDWDMNLFYISNGEEFQLFDPNSGASDNLPAAPGISLITGITYVPADSNSIWVFGEGEGGGAYSSAFDFDSYEFGNTVTEIYEPQDGNAKGMSSSDGYNAMMYDVTIVGDMADDDDFISIHEGVAAPVDWLWIEGDTEGVLDPDDEIDITVTADIREASEQQFEHGDVYNAIINFSGPHWDNPVSVEVVITFVNQGFTEEGALPTTYALHQNFPNPFNPVTQIKFDLVEQQHVKLVVYNLLGQEVMHLADRRMDAGYHTVQFNARDLASGMYFYRIEAGPLQDLKKMVLVK
ncbi:T9SS type A sorting domain-containing protein, partial [bacterium]|nr:T9SS type A sorting domain-containing protein [bacterium]